MANTKQSVFIRVDPGKIKINGRIVSQNEQIVGDYYKINGLPGMHFIGYKDEIDRANKNNTITVLSSESDDFSLTVETNSDYKLKEQTIEEYKEKGFTPERLKELKSIKPVQWVKKKKSEFIEILEEGDIDYSAVKDDRMALYKFLVGILEEL